MRNRERIVVDTNVLISRLLVPNGAAGRAARLALDDGCVLISEALLQELAEVLMRPKFNAYVSVDDRLQFLRLLDRTGERVSIARQVQVCRDPKDDKILDIAINGAAGLVLTGDRDLLSLHPYEGISILSPADFLAWRVPRR